MRHRSVPAEPADPSARARAAFAWFLTAGLAGLAGLRPAAAWAGEQVPEPARPAALDGTSSPLPSSAAPVITMAPEQPDLRGQELPQPFKIGGQPAWFLLGGVSTGYTAMGDRGGFVGGELSLARLLSGRTLGLYADAYYDFGADGTYVSAGPELGWKFLAVDGGFAARFDGGMDGTDLGGTARLCATVGVVSLCGRYSRFDADEDKNVIQVGVLFKMPLISPSGGY
jgi:hypothetical protein